VRCHIADVLMLPRVSSKLLPVILGLQKLELLFDPVAGLGDGELERLPRLVGDLNPNQIACEGREEELSHQSSVS